MSDCFDMKCPRCGASDEIDVAATVWVRLCHDGTDIFEAHNGDHEWSDDSAAVCCGCGHAATVRDFSKAEGHAPDNPVKENTVIIEVFGGVAHVRECPRGVTVKIIDHDINEDSAEAKGGEA